MAALRRWPVRRSTCHSYVANTRLHVAPYIGSNRKYPAPAAHARRSRGEPRPTTHERTKERRRWRAGTEDGPQHPKHAAQGARRCLPRGHAPAQRHQARRPTQPGRDTAMRLWKPEQHHQFLDEIAEHRMATAFVVAARTGMRRGEVIDLTWRALGFRPTAWRSARRSSPLSAGRRSLR